MPKVLLDIHVSPIGTGSCSVSEYVTVAEQVLKNYPEVQSRLNPMTTTLEGELDTLLKIVREMHEAPFGIGALRVSTTLRIDDRRDGKTATMAGKVQSVQDKLNA